MEQIETDQKAVVPQTKTKYLVRHFSRAWCRWCVRNYCILPAMAWIKHSLNKKEVSVSTPILTE